MNRRQYTFNGVRLSSSPLNRTIPAFRPLLIIPLLAMFLAVPAMAKVTVSVATGNWSSAATWNNGVPADGDQITITVGHTVTLTADVNFIAAGSSLTTNGVLNMSTFLCRVVTNTVAANGQVIQNTVAGTAQQANLRGTTVTLHPTSTYFYTGNQTGFTSTHPAYGNLSYASTAAGNGVFEVNLNVGGNLTINNSGSGEIRFGDALNHTHNIAGSLLVTAGNVVGSNGAANILLDVNGGLTIGGGASFKACAAAGGLTINLAGNLTQNGTLTSTGVGTFRVVFDGSGNSTISGTVASIPLSNVTMNKTGSALAILAQNLAIGKNLTFTNGKIQTANFNLTMAALATITGASAANGFVETTGMGKLIFAQTNPIANFPVGKGSFTPAQITTTAFASTYGVRVEDGFLADTGCTGFVTDDAVKKMWIVTREAGTGTIQNMEMTWNGSDEGTTFNRNVCGMVQYTNSNWENAVPNMATGSNPYQRARIFAGLIGGTFGVIDTSSQINLTAPSGTSNSPLCAGATLNLTRTSQLIGGAIYQWSKQGGGFNPTPGPDASIPNVQPANAGNYLLTMSKYGCNYTSSAVAVTISAPPVCSIAGPPTVCANTPGHIYAGPGGQNGYEWSITGNGTLSGPNNGPTATVNANASGTYTVTLTVTGTNGCKTTCTQVVTVTARPTGVLSGNAAICVGGSATLSIAVTGTGPWGGTLSNGINFSGNSSPIGVTVSPAMQTTYTLATLQDATCAATPNDLSGQALITIEVLQIFQMTGGGAYCIGGNGSEVGLSDSEPGTMYQLKLNGNPVGSPVAGTGSPLSFGLQAAVGNYTAMATRIGIGCMENMGGSVNVSINPLPVVSLNLGDDSANALEINVPLTGGSPTGGTYDGPGVAGNAINPSAAGIGMHTITYTVTDNNGCSNTATDVFTVTPAPGLNLFLDAPESAECGEEFVVDVEAAANFTDLGTLQFSVAWDTSVFTTIAIEPQTVDNSVPLTGFIGGVLVYSWLDSSGMYGASLPDGSLLLRLRFRVLNCGANGTVSIVGSPRVIEASDLNYAVVPVVLLGVADISVEDTQPPAFTSLPANTTVSCSNIPAPGQPTATDNCDANPGVLYLGQSTAPGACPNKYMLTRTWRATDACGNSITGTQLIAVTDTTAPTFAVPANTTISLNAQCQYDTPAPGTTGTVTNAADNCSPAQALVATFTDQFVPTSGGQGSIQRAWVVTDECGNTASSQIQIIAVQDLAPPTVVCPNSVTVSGSGGECEFAPAFGNYDPTVSDNCGISTTAYTLSGATQGNGFGSLDGVMFAIGQTTVTWTVTDINGQVASCSFSITVNECSGISGKLIWKGDPDGIAGVALANVALTGDASDLFGPTDPSGLFTVTGGGNVTLTPTKTTPPADSMNGVTAADALVLLNHLNNNPPITDPYKLMAADIDLNNVLDGNDWQAIRRAVLGSPQSLALFKAKPWRFVPTPSPGPGFPGYTPAANPFLLPIPESRPLLGVSGGVAGQDFFGLKMGDLDYSANPNLKPEAQLPVVLLTRDQVLTAGKEYEVTFRTSHFDDLTGYQFALQFETSRLQLLDIDLANTPLGLNKAEHFGLYNIAEGEIRSVWLDAVGQTLPEGIAVFTLRFRALEGGALLSDVLRLESNILVPEAYTIEQGRAEVQLVFTDAQTTDVTNPAAAAGVHLLQNRPNPFSGVTAIGFVLPQACDAQLRVFDATGRELFRLNKAYPAGYSEETVRVNAAAGILYYELTTPFGQLARRMVISD
ncbi:MAG: HYR domain-containing protein [Lewinellaceae bacterium]|nr:HYR domain-containing protein [Lewinellaceae bacterium]